MLRAGSIHLWPALACLLLVKARLQAQETAERVVIVARGGKLSEAEVSPSPQLKVPALWKLALEGISLTRVELKDGVRLPSSPDELKQWLLPAGIAAEVVDWRRGSGVEAVASGGVQTLHKLFGVPPAPTAAEAAGVAAFLAAFGPTRVPELATQGQAVTTQDLGWLARSAVTIVRVDAVSDGAAAASERDELLDKVMEKAGPAANIMVVNLPERGAGTVIARGPRLKKARVSEKPRSIAAVKGIVSLLFDPIAAEKNPAIEQESVHEIFK